MITPVGYCVLLKRQDITEFDPVYQRARAVGIKMAETEEHQRMQAAIDKGTVVAIGPNAYEKVDKPWCKVGDTVIFAKYSGKPVEDTDQTKYILLNDDDILAVVT